MDISDITKAMWQLNGLQLIDKVEYIADDVIAMTSGTTYLVSELAADYDKEYGG